jgi:hypothetical protein
MTALRFKIQTEDEFKQEFKSLLTSQAMKGELKEKKESVFRFDLIREIFLERGL